MFSRNESSSLFAFPAQLPPCAAAEEGTWTRSRLERLPAGGMALEAPRDLRRQMASLCNQHGISRGQLEFSLKSVGFCIFLKIN